MMIDHTVMGCAVKRYYPVMFNGQGRVVIML